MQQVSIDQGSSVGRALQHHLAGRLAEAERVYRQVLAQQPNHPEALYLLGTMAQQVGRNDAAIQLLRKAAEFAPADARYHVKLAAALQGLRQLDDAVAEFSKAIQLDPASWCDAHFGLGNCSLRTGAEIPEAIDAHLHAIRIRPNFPEAHYNLGCILHSQRKMDEAIAAYSRALQMNPTHAAAYNNMGNAAERNRQTRRGDRGVYPGRRNPSRTFIDAHVNLGTTLCASEKRYDRGGRPSHPKWFY